MLSTWVFFVTLMLPTFGGPIIIRVETVNEASCHRFRRVMIRQMEQGFLRAVLSECQPASHSEAGT
jgi:hypothetical protein